MESGKPESGNEGLKSAPSTPLRLDKLSTDLCLGDKDEEKVTVHLPCDKIMITRRDRSTRNETGPYTPWMPMQDVQDLKDTITNRKFDLELSSESTPPKESFERPDSVRPGASKGGKDLSLLKCLSFHNVQTVQSPVGKGTARPCSSSTSVSAEQEKRIGPSREQKRMNFLHHAISLHKHLISKRIAHLQTYKRKMRKDHELFELVINIRRNPNHRHRVVMYSDEWYMLKKTIGIPKSKLEAELERRDDRARLVQIQLTINIHQLQHDLEDFRIARSRLRASQHETCASQHNSLVGWLLFTQALGPTSPPGGL